jgi:hypothetical protein
MFAQVSLSLGSQGSGILRENCADLFRSRGGIGWLGEDELNETDGMARFIKQKDKGSSQLAKKSSAAEYNRDQKNET